MILNPRHHLHQVIHSQPGYLYFGARYYDSDISVWLSVDPLSDKYPSMSAFMYTAGNPVMLIDPDGMRIFIYTKDNKKLRYKDGSLFQKSGLFKWEKYDGKDEYAIGLKNKLNLLGNMDCEMENIINVLSNSKQNHKIKYRKNSAGVVPGNSQIGETKKINKQMNKAKQGKRLGSTIYIDDDNSLLSFATISHELKHSFDLNNGELNFSNVSIKVPDKYGTLINTSIKQYEVDAVNVENKIRAKMFPVEDCNYRRMCYKNKPIPETHLK